MGNKPNRIIASKIKVDTYELLLVISDLIEFCNEATRTEAKMAALIDRELGNQKAIRYRDKLTRYNVSTGFRNCEMPSWH